MVDSVKIEGLEELQKTMQGVTADLQRKGFRFALRKAAQVVRDQAKANVRPHDDLSTGRSIAKNLTEKWSSTYYKQSGGDMKFRVGVSGGAVLPKKGETPDFGANGPTPHWRLLEFGTEKMAAHPFLVPALTHSMGKVFSTFVAEAGKAVDRAVKRSKKG